MQSDGHHNHYKMASILITDAQARKETKFNLRRMNEELKNFSMKLHTTRHHLQSDIESTLSYADITWEMLLSQKNRAACMFLRDILLQLLPQCALNPSLSKMVYKRGKYKCSTCSENKRGCKCTNTKSVLKKRKSQSAPSDILPPNLFNIGNIGDIDEEFLAGLDSILDLV